MNGKTLVKTGWLLVGVLLLVLLLHPHLRQALGWQFRLYSPRGAAYRHYIFKHEIWTNENRFRDYLARTLPEAQDTPEGRIGWLAYQDLTNREAVNHYTALVKANPENIEVLAAFCREVDPPANPRIEDEATAWLQPHHEYRIPADKVFSPEDKAIQKQILDVAEKGELLDKGNSFFPLTAANVFARSGEMAQMRQAIERASQCDRYEDYWINRADRQYRMYTARFPGVTPQETAFFPEAVSAPHLLGPLMSRIATQDAWMLEEAGLVAEGLKARHCIYYTYATIAAKNTCWVGNGLVRAGFEIARERPGGAEPPEQPPFLSQDQNNELAFQKMTDFLAEHGRDDLVEALYLTRQSFLIQKNSLRQYFNVEEEALADSALKQVLLGAGIGAAGSMMLLYALAVALMRWNPIRAKGTLPAGARLGVLIPVTAMVVAAFYWRGFLNDALNQLYYFEPVMYSEYTELLVWAGFLVTLALLASAAVFSCKEKDPKRFANILKGTAGFIFLCVVVCVPALVFAFPGYMFADHVVRISNHFWLPSVYAPYLLIAFPVVVFPFLVYFASLFIDPGAKRPFAVYLQLMKALSLYAAILYLSASIPLGMASYKAGERILETSDIPGSFQVETVARVTNTPWPDRIYIPKPNTLD